jgi:hypothetical protein
MTMPDRYEALARYNAERDRGLMHTPQWDAKMAELQSEFEQWVDDQAEYTRRKLRIEMFGLLPTARERP